MDISESANPYPWNYLRYSESPVDNVFAQNPARNILGLNWTDGSNYVGIIQNSLKWRGVTSVNQSGQLNIDSNSIAHAFSQNVNVITVTVGPDEMLVLKP